MNDLIIHYDDEEELTSSKKEIIPKNHCGIFAKGLSVKQIDTLKYNGFVLDKSGYMIAPICDRNNDLIKYIHDDSLDAFLSPNMCKFYKVKEIQKQIRELKKKVKDGTVTDYDYSVIIRYLEDEEIPKHSTVEVSKPVDLFTEERTEKKKKVTNAVKTEEKQKRHRRTKAELIADGYYNK